MAKASWSDDLIQSYAAKVERHRGYQPSREEVIAGLDGWAQWARTWLGADLDEINDEGGEQ